MIPKEQIIKVFEIVLKNYQNDTSEKDLICKVVKNIYNDGCKCCPLYKSEQARCGSMFTYPANNGNSLKSFQIRAEFFTRAIKILKKIPKERFEPKDWKYFKNLFNLDKRLKNDSKYDII